jgi:HD superfamily phosphohydrolase
MRRKIDITEQSMDFVHDRLYKRVGFNADELRLFQTKELARLRHVSLSAIPTWTIPTGVCASKFEHSVGVAHLAKVVASRPEFEEISRDLYFAALAHDLGTPPFSHASEYFQVKLTGKNHEVFAEEVIEGGEFAKEVKRQGGDIDRVLTFVKGEDKPMSDLINGTIDVDNLDNTLRYGMSMGLLTEQLYSPEELARAYAVRGGELVLLADHTNGLPAWERTRRLVYEFVYGEVNLSAGMTLFRALDFARREGEIKRDYFLMTDSEAFNYLLTKCNSLTRELIERANRWIFYPRVFNFRGDDVSEQFVSYVMDSDNRGQLADEISSRLHIPPEDVSVYMGKDKGFKKIHFPIVGNGRDQEHQPQRKLAYMVQVYVHPRWADRTSEVEEVVNNKLS